MQPINNPVVLIHKIDFKLPEEIYISLLSTIREEKREKIKRFRFREDALRSLFGELLLKYVLKKSCDIDYQREIITENEFGKPALMNKQVSFNISHSGDWAAVICYTAAVGIDIEKVEDPPYEILPKNFTLQEIKQIEDSNPKSKAHQFYKIWTLKESYIKMIGQGLSLPLDSFSIDISDINSIKVSEKNPGVADLYFQLFYPDENHIMAVCLKNFHKQIYPNLVLIDQLLLVK